MIHRSILYLSMMLAAPACGSVTHDICGDGILETDYGEVCEDGNTADGDGCSADCRSAEICGNGIVDTAVGEVCDDGNTAAEDGCSADCRSDETCGNGVTDSLLGEFCDDGNDDNWDTCHDNCTPTHWLGMYNVFDGPYRVYNPPSFSCRAACALLFGEGFEYRCSVDPMSITQTGYYSGYLDSMYCENAQPDDFVAGAANYNCGTMGCSYSAYVQDQCENSINHCWR